MNIWTSPLVYMTLINNLTDNWEKENDYRSAHGIDSVMDDHFDFKDEETTVLHQSDPQTNQPRVQSPLQPAPPASI